VIDALKPLTGFNLEAMKFPESKIGEVVSLIGEGLLQKTPAPQSKLGEVVSSIGQGISDALTQPQVPPNVQVKVVPPAGAPPKIPVPPRLRPKVELRRHQK
jgi:hypothetical protein